MIDEKRLIEDIEDDAKRILSRVFGEVPSEFIDDFLKEMKELVNDQPKVGEWISCSEMLPSIDMSYPNAKDYLVYYEHGYYDVASYSNINRFWHEHTTKPYWNCVQYCEVIAWQPLPEPYKDGDKE